MNGTRSSLWRRQVFAILKLELKKSFFSRRGAWIYLLALAPLIPTGGHAVGFHGRDSIELHNRMFASIFQLFYLRLGLYFGCLGIFSNLFRGEVLEKTLHYYLLTPVRREVLAAGKYLAGLTAAAVIFCGSVATSFLVGSTHYPDYLLNGPGLSHLGWYVLVTLLACVGYGAVFLAAGLIFRNPMIPAAVVMVWENMNPFLPPLLQKFSVIFYLRSLCPVELPVRGPLSIIVVVTQPTPAWLAVPGVLAVSALVLWYAARRLRTFEISYTE